jgi:hypothetical protein
MTLTLCLLGASAQLPSAAPFNPAASPTYPAPAPMPTQMPLPQEASQQPAQPEVWYMKDAKLSIPIRIKPELRNEVSELRLWVSENEGKTWAVYDVQKPDRDAFNFEAKKEGPYWFSVTLVDRVTKKEDPPNVYQVPPAQRVVIDWTKPDVRANAVRRGDEIEVNWAYTEANPALETFKVEYRTPDMEEGRWYPAPAVPTSGRTSFKAPGAGPVTVRVSMQDLAKNEGVHEIPVPAAVPTGQPNWNAQTADRTPTPPVNPGPLNMQTSVPTPNVTGPQDGVVRTVPANGLSEERRQVVSTTVPNAVGADLAQPPPNLGTAAPQTMIINKRQYRLDFVVDMSGPSGVGGIEVYQTVDNGVSWERVILDPAGVVLPLPSDSKSAGPQRGSVLVNLPKEGVVYGFYLVVKSRSGRSLPAPGPGTSPQARLECDLTPPQASIDKIEPDPNRSNAVVLIWKATDRNLIANPVSLEWAPQPTGPWNFIGPPEHPASGEFSWQITPDVPPNVYLRIKARDAAGNVASGQTDKPVTIDLVLPTGHFEISAPK